MFPQSEPAARDEGPWHVTRTECRICRAKAVAVVPHGADWEALECFNCHSMTAEVVEVVPKE